MTVTLDNVRPLPRVDQPWTRIRWREGPTADGPWTVIEPDAPLPAPIDADPSKPAARMLTTNADELEHGWYLLTFIDADGNEQDVEPIPGDEVAAGLLATLDDLRRYLITEARVSTRDAQIDGELLWQLLEAASDRMRRARPERTLVPIPASPSAPAIARTFRVSYIVQVPDLRTVSSVTLDGTELEPDAYELAHRDPADPALWLRLRHRAYGMGLLGAGELVIAGHWGPTRPWPSVREACLSWAARVFHMRTSRFADNAPAGPDGGVLGYFRNLPPDVKVVLDDLLIPGV